MASTTTTATTTSSTSTTHTPPTSLPTPDHAVADFCLIPLGTPTPSVSQQIADVQRLVKKSGLHYSMHSAGTTIEGSWADVMAVIGHAHYILHGKGVLRIQTDIRVGTRTDKVQSFPDKVAAVEKLLAADEPEPEPEPLARP